MALTDKLTAIADAIRAKTGKTDSMTLEQMPTEIASITGGGEGEKPFDCHSVTFVYGDKSYVRSVADGDTCADPVERGLIPTPTKASTAQYNYTFYGWGASDGGAADANILKNITEDKTVYAIFTATVRYYTITWLDDDGTVLNTQTLAYGATPGYTPTITKDNYSFAGWSPAISKVTGNASYTATWKENGWRWNLADGVLTISGAGPMEDYSSSTPAPWNGSASLIKKVVIEDGITKVGKYAFFGCSALTDIQFGNLVSTIDQSAFGNCTALTSVTIPGTVTYLGWAIFNGCSKLTDIVLEEGTETIIGSSGALQNTGLKRLTVRAKCICWQMYANCKTLTSVTFGSAVQGITSNAFYGCSNISSVVFEDTSGWYVTTTEGATSGTTLSSANLANTSTAATYLKTTYLSHHWYNT